MDIPFACDGGLLRASLRCWDGSSIRIVVEPMPSGGWDWTVWHRSNPKLARHGEAGTAARAAATAGFIAEQLMEAASALPDLDVRGAEVAKPVAA